MTVEQAEQKWQEADQAVQDTEARLQKSSAGVLKARDVQKAARARYGASGSAQDEEAVVAAETVTRGAERLEHSVREHLGHLRQEEQKAHAALEEARRIEAARRAHLVARLQQESAARFGKLYSELIAEGKTYLSLKIEGENFAAAQEGRFQWSDVLGKLELDEKTYELLLRQDPASLTYLMRSTVEDAANRCLRKQAGAEFSVPAAITKATGVREDGSLAPAAAHRYPHVTTREEDAAGAVPAMA